MTPSSLGCPNPGAVLSPAAREPRGSVDCSFGVFTLGVFEKCPLAFVDTARTFAGISVVAAPSTSEFNGIQLARADHWVGGAPLAYFSLGRMNSSNIIFEPLL